MWKARRPQRRHRVCVLVWRRPKLPVPLPHLPMVRLYLRQRAAGAAGWAGSRAAARQRGQPQARAVRRQERRPGEAADRRSCPLLLAASAAPQRSPAPDAAPSGLGAGPPGGLGRCQAWRSLAWLRHRPIGWPSAPGPRPCRSSRRQGRQAPCTAAPPRRTPRAAPIDAPSRQASPREAESGRGGSLGAAAGDSRLRRRANAGRAGGRCCV